MLFSYSAASLFMFSFWSLGACGGKLSQGSLKLFVFDSRNRDCCLLPVPWGGGEFSWVIDCLGPSSSSAAIYKRLRTKNCMVAFSSLVYVIYIAVFVHPATAAVAI